MSDKDPCAEGRDLVFLTEWIDLVAGIWRGPTENRHNGGKPQRGHGINF